MWNNVVNAWWPLIFYPATDAPRFRPGMIAMLGTCGATLVVTGLVWFLERREWRRYGTNAPGAGHSPADSDQPDHGEIEKRNSGSFIESDSGKKA